MVKGKLSPAANASSVSLDVFESFYGNEMRTKAKKKKTESFKRGRRGKADPHLRCICRPDPPRVSLCNTVLPSYCCLSSTNQQSQSIISPRISTESSSLAPTGGLAWPFLTLPSPLPLLFPGRLAGNQAVVLRGGGTTSLVTKGGAASAACFQAALVSSSLLRSTPRRDERPQGNFVFSTQAKPITCAGRTGRIVDVR